MKRFSAYSYTFVRGEVCLSVVRHSLLKLFDCFRCRLVSTLVVSNDTLCQMEVSNPKKGKIRKIKE